eukprot:3531735-Amphidinium_carterae.1
MGVSGGPNGWTGTAEMSQMLTKDDTVLMVFKTLPIGIEKEGLLILFNPPWNNSRTWTTLQCHITFSVLGTRLSWHPSILPPILETIAISVLKAVQGRAPQTNKATKHHKYMRGSFSRGWVADDQGRHEQWCESFRGL